MVVKKMSSSFATLVRNPGLDLSLMNLLDLTLDVHHNPFGLRLETLFDIAARKNPKRNFLFVSKVLGKYVPVPPQVPLITGMLLADLLLKEMEGSSSFNAKVLANSLEDYTLLDEAMLQWNLSLPVLSKKTCFIGFAETATALGHSVFHPFRHHASFIHTTRENIISVPSAFTFEEVHSHATQHQCFPEVPSFFKEADRIVLIDDEITSGNTVLNLICALNDLYPGKEYVVLSILDWRKQEDVHRFKQFTQQTGVRISNLSLIRGEVTYRNPSVSLMDSAIISAPSTTCQVVDVPLYTSKSFLLQDGSRTYYKPTGRFGISNLGPGEMDAEIASLAAQIEAQRRSEKSAVVGFGEFMFVPNLIAAELSGEISYHSIGRSPIYALDREHYPIGDLIRFVSCDGEEVNYYLYNANMVSFDEIIFVFERAVSEEIKQTLSEALRVRGYSSILFTYLTTDEH
jgi:hypoxanthine-guanine phosphoribosyltransferase